MNKLVTILAMMVLLSSMLVSADTVIEEQSWFENILSAITSGRTQMVIAPSELKQMVAGDFYIVPRVSGTTYSKYPSSLANGANSPSNICNFDFFVEDGSGNLKLSWVNKPLGIGGSSCGTACTQTKYVGLIASKLNIKFSQLMTYKWRSNIRCYSDNSMSTTVFAIADRGDILIKADCSDKCTRGQYRCNSGKIEQCVGSGTECANWVLRESCTSNQDCVQTGSSYAECQNKEIFCTDSDGIERPQGYKLPSFCSGVDIKQDVCVNGRWDRQVVRACETGCTAGQCNIIETKEEEITETLPSEDGNTTEEVTEKITTPEEEQVTTTQPKTEEQIKSELKWEGVKEVFQPAYIITALTLVIVIVVAILVIKKKRSR